MILPLLQADSTFKLAAVICPECKEALYFSTTKRTHAPRFMYCVVCHEARPLRSMKNGFTSAENHAVHTMRQEFIDANPNQATVPERSLTCSPFKSISPTQSPSSGPQQSFL